MAIMIPSTLKSLPWKAKDGERQLFAILDAALPDDCQVRYEVLIGERDWKPDYLVIDPNRGILIVEVKDWDVGTIRHAGGYQFQVAYGRNPSAKPELNPEVKCQLYLGKLRGHLRAMPSLCNESGDLLVESKYLAAFPNISKADYERSPLRLNQFLSADHSLLKEDLEPTGEPFASRYDKILPMRESPLSQGQLEDTIKALVPDKVLLLPSDVDTNGFFRQDETAVAQASGPARSYALDNEQERIAKSIGEGPRLLKGPAGSGKTLVMLYRAKMLMANSGVRLGDESDADAEISPSLRVLILCWNVSLANYMRQVYRLMKVVTDKEVDIQHFSEFARGLLRRHGRANLPTDAQFYAELQALQVKDDDRYDAIFVDEAQDFKKEWIEFIYERLLKGEPGRRNLLVAADDDQRVYSARDFAWDQVRIPWQTSTEALRTVYRNSLRVWAFAALSLGQERIRARGVKFAGKSGWDPKVVSCPNIHEQIEESTKIVRKFLDLGYAPKNFLILYHERSDALISQLFSCFSEKLGIRPDWIAQDQGAKETFEWEKDTVKVSTVQSAKGMDSPFVIVLGAEMFGTSDDERRLLYVALTRAREALYVYCSGDEGLAPLMKKTMRAYTRHKPAIVELEKRR
jgi:hypothetical protein